MEFKKFKEFYDKNFGKYKEKYEKKAEEKIQNIRNEFSLERWKTLTVKEYKTVGTKDSLCYILENELKKEYEEMPKVDYDTDYGYRFNAKKNEFLITNLQNKGEIISEKEINEKWNTARKNMYDFLQSIQKAKKYEEIILSPEENKMSSKVFIILAYIYFPDKVIGIVGLDYLKPLAKMLEIDIQKIQEETGKNYPICLNYEINKEIRKIKGLEDANGYILSAALWDFIQNRSDKNLKEKTRDQNRNIENNEKENDELKKGENIVFYGIPGCGKSWYVNNIYLQGVDDDRIERVTFHPEYTYEDFIGQILPKIRNKMIEYIFVPGPFTNILKKAVDPKNKKKQFYLIIEELNRGNAPAIFGDIFQLLDRNQEGESEYSINNIEIAKEIYHNEETKIKIPKNLTILATMNTSDQNIFTLDTAFKRRFKFRICANRFNGFEKEDKAKYYIPDKNHKIEWVIFVDRINELIREQSQEQILALPNYEDKLIGYYFIEKDLLCKDKHNKFDKEKADDFASKIIMYLWNDIFKYNRDEIFNDKELNECIRNFYDKGIDIFNHKIKERIQKKEESNGENNEE